MGHDDGDALVIERLSETRRPLGEPSADRAELRLEHVLGVLGGRHLSYG